MLHNFWFMDQKLFWVGCPESQFYADYDEKISFPKFLIFQVNSPLSNFEFFLTIFPKLRGRKISKFRFMGQFLTLKNMVTKFFQNSNFSDFLGIKSEISHWIPLTCLKNITVTKRTTKIRVKFMVLRAQWVVLPMLKTENY